MGRSTLITYQGTTLSQKQWAAQLHITPSALIGRKKRLGSWDKALAPTLEDHCAAPRPCLWCPVHEVAWIEPIEGAPQWHPMPRAMLALAMAYAKAGGCPQHIHIQEVACDRCHQYIQKGA